MTTTTHTTTTTAAIEAIIAQGKDPSAYRMALASMCRVDVGIIDALTATLWDGETMTAEDSALATLAWERRQRLANPQASSEWDHEDE